MGDTARYCHTSLYKFSPTARAEIVTRAGSAIDHGSVKCRYDTNFDAFVIECPNSLGIGAVADEKLGAIIRNYVQQELEAAEEDERTANIRRFNEANFVDLTQIADDAEDVKPNKPPQLLQARTHIVRVSDVEGKRIKFLSLYTLPDRLLERTLAPHNEKVNRLLIDGLTCRAVRWDNRKGDVFNGRTGVGQSIVLSEADQIQLPDFHALKDERGDVYINERLPTKTWEHVGDDPWVERWVQGTGLIRYVEVSEKADIPRDAQKYLANAAGRLRKPKGHDLLPEAEEKVDESTWKGGAGNAPGLSFEDLMAGNIADDESDDDDDAAEESADGVSDDAPAPTFAQLMNGDAKGAPMPPPKRNISGNWDAFRPQSRTPKPSPFSTLRPLPSRTPTPTTQALDDRTNTPQLPPATMTAASQESSAQGVLQEYGRRYAKVDNIGLTASASNTAQWDTENYVYRTPKKKSRPVVARNVPATAGSTGGSTSSAVPSRTVTPSQQASHQAQWANKRVPNKHQQGPKLVDDSAATTDGTVEVPPGLNHSGGEHTGQTRQRLDIVSDDEIQERVTQLPANYTAKRNTMRQKAGKKTKGKKAAAKAPAPKAQLPLPSPPPPPKRKQKDATATSSTPRPISEPEPVLRTAMIDSGSSSDEEPPRIPPTGPSSIASRSHAFGQRLLDSKRTTNENYGYEDEDLDSDTAEKVKLVSSFGILLVRSTGKEISRRVLTSTSSQKQLNASHDVLRTDVLTHLTTSKDDAAYLLHLSAKDTEDVEAETMYEIWCRDVSGTRLVLRVPTQQKINYSVKTRDRSVAEAYVHYPTHVWDAAFAVVKQGTDHKSLSDRAIEEFVSSMQTEKGEEIPSFRAMERAGQLDIHRVFAKRIFTRTEPSGTLKVTEVQEMRFEPMNDGRHNFKAVVLPRAEMIHSHRLWFEAGWETDDLENAGLLEEKVDAMVTSMDAVGMDNKGPYEFEQPEEVDNQPPPKSPGHIDW